MILDRDKYSSPILSMSTSTYLYKGKNKKRTDPSSYRKVSIGSICNKIVDCYMEDTVKGLIKSKQSDLQYGFIEGVDFKGCMVLRETAVNYNTAKGKMTMILAVDVSNAFSRTQREYQLYELWKSGACGREYSRIILEHQGSEQGGKLSAGDFVVYNSSWSRIIEAVEIGLKVEGYFYGAFECADDSLSCTTSIVELIAVTLIYEYFRQEYDVQFAYSKCMLNVFNDDKVKKLLQEEDLFTIGGHKPLFEESSLHLGIMMTEKLDELGDITVEHRMTQTKKKIFMSFTPNISNHTSLPFRYLQKLY